MKQFVLLAATLTSLLIPALARAQKLVYIVRHAERADDATRDEADPPLSAAGQARAVKLSEMLADAGIKAIYVSPYRRTQQTVAPLAAKIHVKLEPIPLTAPALVSQLKSQHANDIVLIVVHTSTIDQIVKALGGPQVKVGEHEYDSLFVLIPGTGLMSRIRY